MKLPLSFLIIIIGLSVFAGCQKVCDTGTVRFTCNSDNPYRLYIDGVFKANVNGHTYIEYDLSEGSHSANVEQISGYLLYPTTDETTLNVYGCKDLEWVFP